MWSLLKKKFLFIDFGMTCIIAEPIGIESLRSFQGTHTYVIPEMKRLYMLDSKGYVDLYYNDVFGLIKSFELHNHQEEPLA